MKKLISAFCFLLSALALFAQAPLLRTGWTTNSNPTLARSALGISATNGIGINLTNNYTNFNVSALQIGQGSNAVTLTPTNAGITSDVGFAAPWFSASGSVTSAAVVASSYSLNGTTITAWPSGGSGNSYVVTGNTFTNSFTTNYAVIGSGLYLGSFTNGFNSGSYQNLNGDGLGWQSRTNGNTNWFDVVPPFNSTCELQLVVLFASFTGTAAVSNLVISSLTLGQTTGNTNDFTLQVMRVAEPVAAQDATTKQYVDSAAVPRTWSRYPASANVLLARNPLYLSPEWNWKTAPTNNEMRAALDFAGNCLAVFSPGFSALTNGTTISVGTNDVVTVGVWTNYTPPFRVLWSSNNLTTLAEVFATNNLTPTGSNFTLTFPKIATPGAFLLYVGRSNAASVKLPPIESPTINNPTLTGTITNGGAAAMTINIPVMTNSINAGTMYFTNGILMKFQ